MDMYFEARNGTNEFELSCTSVDNARTWSIRKEIIIIIKSEGTGSNVVDDMKVGDSNICHGKYILATKLAKATTVAATNNAINVNDKMKFRTNERFRWGFSLLFEFVISHRSLTLRTQFSYFACVLVEEFSVSLSSYGGELKHTFDIMVRR